MNYCRGLSFEQEPDYEYLQGLLSSMQHKIAADASVVAIDWTLLKAVRYVGLSIIETKGKNKS